MTAKTNNKSLAKASRILGQALAPKNPAKAKAAKRNPGDATALRNKANDNLAKQAKAKGRTEVIKSAVAARTGNGFVVTTSRDRTIVIGTIDKTVQLLAKLGEPVDLLERYLAVQPKADAKLARGVEARAAPHSAKAVSDQKAKAPKAADKGKAKAKAPKAAKAKAGGDYSYKPTKKANEAKPDSLRGKMLAIILANTNTADAKAAAAKAKLAGLNSGWFNWAAANGYITK